MRAFGIVVGVVLLVSPAVSAAPVVVADQAKALVPIVVSAKASAGVKTAAATLADYLGRISGAKFAVETGDGSTGLAVGRAEDFGQPGFGDAKDPTHTEYYRLKTHPRGMLLLGASELAVEHAIWDVLYRLGYRQFFPGPTWEIVPHLDRIALDVDLEEKPAYWARSIWYGFGPWDYAAGPYRDWCARNRMARGIDLHTGHAYDAILRRNAAAFKEHPEYLGLWNGKRQSTHFCISNPGLRKLVVEDSLRQFAAKPDMQSISLEPSDGASWCQCEQCKKMGSVSDRALTLANDVAEAVTAKYGDRFVGMYAYSEHSPPPTIQVHPHVIVSVATAFVRGGFTTEQLMKGWQAHGATLGVREYYSVNTWDRDLPGAARGGNVAYLRKTIPEFHKLGARFLSAESSDNWGPNGLGYYVASRMMWNPAEAERADALVADFLEKAFGAARQPMAEFYRLIDAGKRPLLCDDLVGRMYRLLEKARSMTKDNAILARLDDLVLYTRYVELYSDYSTATGPDRQEAFERLIKHAYRMRKTMMVHTKALYRDLAGRDKSVRIPTEAGWSVAEAKNPWKSSERFAASEVGDFVTAGIKNRPLLDFEPVAFGTELIPATRLKLPAVTDGSMGIYYRGNNAFLLWLDQPSTVKLDTKAGVIYGNQGDGKFALFPAAEVEGKAVAEAKAAPDRADHPVEMKSEYSGLHRLEAGGGGGVGIRFPSDLPVTVLSSPEQPFHFHGRWTMYFYVPKGTKSVGGFASGPGKLRDGAGKEVHNFDKRPNYFSIPVGARQDGTLWKFENTAGLRTLMTVPPYLARSPRDLLLPAEVVDKDAR